METQMQSEMSQLQRQLRQLRAEGGAHDAKAKQKGIPTPPTVPKFRQAQAELERADQILAQQPDNYQGHKGAAMRGIHQALIEIERCKPTDWRLAEKVQH